MWLDGLSASQIANELANGITRNAVIGKVHRLGLSGRVKSPAPAPARPRARSQGEDGNARRPRPSSMAISPSPSKRVPLRRRRRAGRGRSRRPDLRARRHHGSARVDVPLAAGRSHHPGFPLLRREDADRRWPLLHLSRPHRLSAGAWTAAATAKGAPPPARSDPPRPKGKGEGPARQHGPKRVRPLRPDAELDCRPSKTSIGETSSPRNDADLDSSPLPFTKNPAPPRDAGFFLARA